jgi:hypothetical protein
LLLRAAVLGVALLLVVAGVWSVRGRLGRHADDSSNEEAGRSPVQKPTVAEVSPVSPRRDESEAVREEKPKQKQAERPGKPDSLAGAIRLVENAERRKVLRAERNGEGAEIQFRIDLLEPGGARVRVRVNAGGRMVREPAARAEKAKPEKFRTPGPADAKGVKVIALHEAVRLVEMAGKGAAVRAEQRGEGPAAQFDVEVVGPDGGRRRFAVGANGRVIVEVSEKKRKRERGNDGGPLR